VADAVVLVAGWLSRLYVFSSAASGQSAAHLATQVFVSLVGCMLGAAVGVLVARGMGWRRAWLGGMLVGAVLGLGAALLV
jgi:hypothetical protein